jgi:hypothetical protein
MKVHYGPMPNRVTGPYTVWLIDDPPLPWLQSLAEYADHADRAMESVSPNIAGRLLLVADLAQALGLALGMLEGVA